MGGLGAFPITMVIVSIGMSIGGPTGYAMNPARDLGPRIAHQVLPIKGKRDSGWSYAWVPTFAPITGSIIAASVGYLLHSCVCF
jgi:glycerol uptake facilitator protein